MAQFVAIQIWFELWAVKSNKKDFFKWDYLHISAFLKPDSNSTPLFFVQLCTVSVIVKLVTYLGNITWKHILETSVLFIQYHRRISWTLENAIAVKLSLFAYWTPCGLYQFENPS